MRLVRVRQILLRDSLNGLAIQIPRTIMVSPLMT